MNTPVEHKKNNLGFTLTEMLVVVMVVSVLAAIAYPLYTKAATKSRAIEAINLLEMVRNKQLQKFARDKSYYSSFANMGQLTSNKSKEVIEGQVLKVRDYTLSLNNVHSCMKARYNKGNTDFTFSSSYEYTGLGCTGDICTSFGDIIGTAQDVCNCGSKACNGGYTLNQDTCQCQCLLGCDISGSCFAPYGGGSTRSCASGCGTETSSSSCNGPVWSGACWSPTQTQITSQACASGCGTQTRTCTANCAGGSCTAWNTSSCYSPTQTQATTQSCGNSGTQTRTCTPSCGPWGACTGQSCPSSTKPAASQACGNCGTQTRTVTCNSATGTWSAGAWSTCTGQGVCAVGATQSCGSGGTQTCSSSCTWGTCSVIDCNPATKPAATQACGNCNTGTQTRSVDCEKATGTWLTTAWSTCTSGGTCAPGATQACNGTGTQTCSSTCSWGSCSVANCDPATKPASSEPCGNCGTQNYIVTCNTTTGQWQRTAQSNCTGQGVCAVGATQACGGNGTRTCSSSCSWSTCVCNSGYTWNGSTCLPPVNISTTTVNILVKYNFSVISTNYQACYAKDVTGSCSSVNSKTYYQGGELFYDFGGMNGPSMCQMGAEGTEGHYIGWTGGSAVSFSACPSGTNQSICAANCTQPGCSYKCILSESYPSTSSPYIERRCVYPCEIDTDTGCNDQSGTATVLVCSRS